MPVSAAVNVMVTAVVLCALMYGSAVALSAVATHAAHVAHPELAKVIVTLAALLNPATAPPEFVPVTVPTFEVGAVPTRCRVPANHVPTVAALPSVVVLLPWPIAVFPITFSFVSPEASG